MFHYSHYWGTWSRVLQQSNGEYLEVNLTPVNGRYDNSSQALWDESVKPIMLRTHRTERQPGEMADKLPPMVVTAMIINVGAELTHRLITEDLLAEIDLPTLHAKMRGGGIPLAECAKVVSTPCNGTCQPMCDFCNQQAVSAHPDPKDW